MISCTVVWPQSLAYHHEFDPADAQLVPRFEVRLRHTLTVHVRAVRALEIEHLELGRACGQPAMEPRHQCGVEHELGPGRSPDGFDVPRQNAECERRLGVVSGLEYPHVD